MDINKANVLLVDEDGIPSTKLLLRCFRKTRDIRINLISNKNGKLVPIKYSKYIHKFFHSDCHNDEDFINHILEVAKLTKSGVIIPVKQKTIRLFARHRDKFKTFSLPPLAETDKIDLVDDKWYLHNWLRENNFPSPKAALFDFQGKETIMDFNFPILLKPRTSTGGEGIISIKKREDYTHFDQKEVKREKYIIQEHIGDKNIDISLLSKNGKILVFTIQQGIENPKLSYSRMIRFIDDPALLKLATDIIKKLNWSGIAHLDFRYDNEKDRYYLVDFNPRYWSSILGSLHAGVNFPLYTYYAAINKDFQIPSYASTYFYLSSFANLISQTPHRQIRIPKSFA